MWIESFHNDLWPWRKRAKPRNVREIAVKFGDLTTALLRDDRFWLVGLLLVVAGWIMLRLVLTLLAH